MNRFLLIKFPPGAAGKMLVTCLGTHSEIASWNTTNFSELDYAKSRYTGNFDNWLDAEPTNPWKFQKYVSAMYPRGDDIDQLDINFPNLWIPTLWQKTYTARFMQNYFCVNINVDKNSLKWYRKSRWKKQFSVEKNKNTYIITQHQHRPSYAVGNFNNQYKIKTNNLYRFIKENIIDYPIVDHLNNNALQGVSVNLSDMLYQDSFFKILQKIQKQMNIGKHDWSESIEIWKHWRSLHDY